MSTIKKIEDVSVSLITNPITQAQNLLQIFLGYRQCYFADKIPTYMEKYSVEKILANKHGEYEEVCEYIDRMVDRGHLSPLEHASVTFVIEGLSLVTTHQLVRHRLAAYTQKSYRYMDANNFEVIFPNSIIVSPYYDECVEHIQRGELLYNKMITDTSLQPRILKEEARYPTIPVGVITSIQMSSNFRNYFHVFNERCCIRAQPEIRRIFDTGADIFNMYYPVFSKYTGPKCIYTGKCVEYNNKGLCEQGVKYKQKKLGL